MIKKTGKYVSNKLPGDEELVKRLREGDMLSFDTIYLKYADNLFKFGYKYLKNKEEGEELVQIVFLKIWENKKKLNRGDTLKSYIFTIAYNEICKLFRRRSYHNKFMIEALKDSEILTSDTEEGIDYKSTLEQVERIVDLMPERMKQIFISSRFEGKSTNLIAEETGLAPGTIDNYISGALKFIRTKLKDKHLSLALFFFLFLS